MMFAKAMPLRQRQAEAGGAACVVGRGQGQHRQRQVQPQLALEARDRHAAPSSVRSRAGRPSRCSASRSRPCRASGRSAARRRTPASAPLYSSAPISTLPPKTRIMPSQSFSAAWFCLDAPRAWKSGLVRADVMRVDRHRHRRQGRQHRVPDHVVVAERCSHRGSGWKPPPRLWKQLWSLEIVVLLESALDAGPVRAADHAVTDVRRSMPGAKLHVRAAEGLLRRRIHVAHQRAVVDPVVRRGAVRRPCR